MADGEHGYKWWVRYVLVPLIGGGGLIALVVAIINRPAIQSNKHEVGVRTKTESTSKPPPEPIEKVDPKVQVEKLVGRWIDAWIHGRADDFVSVASEPFYFDQKIILTKPELRSEYESLRKIKGEEWPMLAIQSIKVQTARELQNTGHDLSKDRVFGSLNLTLDDYAVIVTTKRDERVEGMLVVVRRVGDGFEIAGTWD
jgi:hypothetical protein